MIFKNLLANIIQETFYLINSIYKTCTAILYLILIQETAQINNLNLHLKQLEKQEQKKPKVSRRKEIIKISSEINEKEIKKL